MRKEALEYLACCLCGGRLVTEKAAVRNGTIPGGKLLCRNCGSGFPVVHGRPVIMRRNSVRRWKAPLDEVLGLEKVEPPLSIPVLAKMGVDKALELAEEVRIRCESVPESNEPICGVTEKEAAEIKFRLTGEWFEHGTRKERLLDFPWNGESGNSFSCFMRRVLETGGETLVDIASGGGFGVSHQVFLNDYLKRVFAVERDLKCLGNIQYRFRYIDRDDRSEAVGGDVRNLPLGNGKIDTAMMLQALHEINSISKMLMEVHRVLKKGGSFVVLVTEKPFTEGLIPLDEYRRFALATDLYSGWERFQSQAEECGFGVVASERLKGGKSGAYRRLISLVK